MIQIEITAMVFTSQYGPLKAGDLLRVSEAEADHLVNECHAAKYVAPESKPIAKRIRARSIPSE